MRKWQVGWGTVSQCNAACAFCYSKATRTEPNQLTYNNWVDFIDDNHESISTINYGTGENTLSPDWFKLIGYIRNNYPEIEQALTTNGFLINQVANNPRFYEIAKHSLDEIDISLDFANEQQYCQFRGVRDIYQWALGSLSFCQKNNIRSTIVFIGGKPILNIPNIDGLFNIANKYNSKLRMNIYRPTNLDAKVNAEFIASYQQVVDVIYHIDSKYKILSLADPLFNAILSDGPPEEDPSGINSVRILHNGNITPSTYLISENFQLCNITENKVLRKIEEEKIFDSLNLNIIPKECKNCSYGTICKGGVYDRRYLWYKSFEVKDPYCPFNEGHFIPERLVKIQADKNFQSIHHGYLPTIFFAN